MARSISLKRRHSLPKNTERFKELNARLKKLKSRQPSGEYYIRPHQIDDFNLDWQAGCPIPPCVREHFYSSRECTQWVMVDTGNEQVVLYANEPIIKQAYEVYLIFGAKNGILLYDPRETKAKNDNMITRYVSHRLDHQRRRHGLK